jgi:hypothetical protein
MPQTSIFCFATGLLGLAMAHSGLAQTPPARSPVSTAASSTVSLTRQYHEGEKLGYHMRATNKGRYSATAYEADVNCVTKKDAAGIFSEECAWSDLVVNGSPVLLSAAAQSLRQTLSLDANATPMVPDLSQVIPLIGPITDLLTFYSDLWLANKLQQLHHAGDHFYFARGTPNSWADGNYVLLGQDSIDFDLTLAEKNEQGIATLVVRHVVPKEPQIKLTADWMKAPVADAPNNWVEVEKSGEGKFSAEIGKETFDVRIKVAGDGKILSATLDNPVEVLERDCTDAELTHCGDPARYQIKRQIDLTLLH